MVESSKLTLSQTLDEFFSYVAISLFGFELFKKTPLNSVIHVFLTADKT